MRPYLLNLLYPPFCRFCGDSLPREHFLCDSCWSLIDPLDYFGRCHVCFTLREKGVPCHCVSKQGMALCAAVFNAKDPAATLLFEAKRGYRRQLCKSLSALMVCQILNLGWPLPDIIVPLPRSKINLYMAEQMAVLLKKKRRILLGYNYWRKSFVLRGSAPNSSILLIGSDLNESLRQGAHLLATNSKTGIFALGYME